MQFCSLCQLSEYTIFDNGTWSIRLNEDQHFLGRCYFVLNRHETDVTLLKPEELLVLWELMAQVKKAVDHLFQPDHYNYVFLMNICPHLHAHIVPRYAYPRLYLGEQYIDGRIGEHYDTGNAHIPSQSTLYELRNSLRLELSV